MLQNIDMLPPLTHSFSHTLGYLRVNNKKESNRILADFF